MSKQLAAWAVTGLAMAGVAGGLAVYKTKEIEAASAAAQAFPEPAEAVASVRARQGEWSATAKAIGTVVARRQLELRNEIAGTVAEIGFSSGDVVEAGQLLIQIDSRQEQALLDAAEAEARLAKSTLDRRESLRGSPAFSAQEFDKAQAEFAAATARAQNLKVSIEKKRIVAPFRARIGITNLQPGAYLDAGTHIATLQGVDTEAYVDFSLPQDSAATIKPGATVTLSNPAIPSGEVTAKIVAESDSIDRANRTVRFRAIAEGLGDAVRPGMFVDVIAATSQPQAALFVPLAAVRRSPSGQHVFVLAEENGALRARQRPVRTGPVKDGAIAILDGLAEGELIAASGSFKLRDGQLVATEAPPAVSTAVRTN